MVDTVITEFRRLDPLDAAERLRGLGRLAFLDSALFHPTLGRYSFLCAAPFATIRVREGIAELDGRILLGHPLAAIRDIVSGFKTERIAGLPPFQGGAVGFLSYEFGNLLEALPPAHYSAKPPPQALFHLYDWVLAFDHAEERSWLISTGLGGGTAKNAHDEILGHLAKPARPTARTDTSLAWRALRDRREHEVAVKETIAYVLAGDIFQANIAQRFSAQLPADFCPFAYYRRLRAANPAPFGAFLDFGEIVIASSSPERFLKVSGRRVEARPIKGTAPRSENSEEDARRATALLASVKDRAENVMIVDLLRNDLSRVCRPHSVEVPLLCGVESYAALHHLVSSVTGELADDRDCFDLIAAAFPGGSITGAPKIRAMELIAQLERDARGPYCGGIGYFGFDGEMDFNIAIRSVVFADDEASLHVGGGITALSDPSAEYEETLLKASRIMAA